MSCRCSIFDMYSICNLQVGNLKPCGHFPTLSSTFYSTISDHEQKQFKLYFSYQIIPTHQKLKGQPLAESVLAPARFFGVIPFFFNTLVFQSYLVRIGVKGPPNILKRRLFGDPQLLMVQKSSKLNQLR